MVALSIQTLLLMGAAYFVGAALACLVRRSLSTTTQASAERRVDPLPEVAPRRAEGARFGRPLEPRRTPAPMAPRAAPPPPASSGAAQDLKNIANIDAGTEARLNKLGVTRYEQIAAWMRADIDRLSAALGQKGRINQENWIEQAQVLAKGGTTVYSARRALGQGSTARPTPDEGERGPPAPSAPLPRPMSRVGVSAVVVTPPPDTRTAAAAAPLAAERTAVTGGQAQAAPALPIRPSAPPSHDNLQRIGGVTAEIEERLNALGVSRYSEIAQWSAAMVERLDRELGSGGRIARENWVEQAQILSRGGDTRFSRQFDHPGQSEAPPPRPIKLPDAIREHEAAVAAAPARADLGSLRSVRSKAYQDTTEPGPEAARRVALRSKVVRSASGGADDLKRIRGIGVLTEKRLNQMGISSYEDIANWTSADIDRVSQLLDFKGRIQRENWVEQARILSAGGDTEFSRRLDRQSGDANRAKP